MNQIILIILYQRLLVKDSYNVFMDQAYMVDYYESDINVKMI